MVLDMVKPTLRKVGKMVPVIGKKMPVFVGGAVVGGVIYYFFL